MTAEQLNQYRWMRHERNQLEERISKLRHKSTGVARVTGMPSMGGSGRAVEDDAITLEQLCEAYSKLSQKINAEMISVEMAIEELADPIQREVMRKKYIDGLPMSEVAMRMNYSERQCWRIHNDALTMMS